MKLVQKLLLSIFLGASLMAGIAVPAQARDRDDRCEQKVRKAEANYDKAVRKHGEHSNQARKKREKLEQAKAYCHGYAVRDRDRDHDRDRH